VLTYSPKVTATSTTTTLGTHHVVACTSGAGTIVHTLPAGAGAPTKWYRVIKVDAGAGLCRVAPAAGEAINGVTNGTQDATKQWAEVIVTLVSPTNWHAEAGVGLASETAAGAVELATAAETTSGTDATRAVTPDGLAGSDYGRRQLVYEIIPDATALSTGDGKAYFPITAHLHGWLVVAVSAHVGAVVSSAGAVTVDIDVCGAVATGIRCSGTNRDLLSTNLTIDVNEDGTETAATPAVINPANDDLVTGEWLRFNVDGAGTGTQGLYVTVVFQKP